MNNVRTGQAYKKKCEPMRIFLVEDSAVVRERLVAMVSEVRGAEIVGYAEDTRRATEHIMAFQPDVIILDIQLSGGSGIEVLSRLRDIDPQVCVIMMTGFATEEPAAKALSLGADDFFKKKDSRSSNWARHCGGRWPA
jgi:two-component system, NarL family, response regulator DevR